MIKYKIAETVLPKWVTTWPPTYGIPYRTLLSNGEVYDNTVPFISNGYDWLILRTDEIRCIGTTKPYRRWDKHCFKCVDYKRNGWVEILVPLIEPTPQYTILRCPSCKKKFYPNVFYPKETEKCKCGKTLLSKGVRR